MSALSLKDSELQNSSQNDNNIIKEIDNQLVTVASRHEVTKQTHIPWCLPASSPGAERSAKPQERQDYHAATLYLPYQALSLPIIPARRGEM
jgi:hypothetical protein